MTMRAIGPFNGTLPIPTGMAIAFVRDSKKFAYTNYFQFVPAPEIQFMYFKLDPDEPSRLKALNEYAWGYDDYRPSGRAFTVRGDWTSSNVIRYDFAWQIGEQTLRIWKKNGVDPKMIYDKLVVHKANLHRAQRCVDVMTGATYEQTTDLNTLLGVSGAYWDKSSGEEIDGGGTENPNFQIIKRTFMRVNRRLHLATNGVANMEDMVCVIPVAVAEKLATAGEIVNILKQSPYAQKLTDDIQYAKWGIPEYLYGVKMVVEDSPRVFINQKTDGSTIADVEVASERDYILTGDTVYFGLRPGGIDGGIGMRNFSTWQLYHYNGEVRMAAFSEPKHELVEGHCIMEDRPLAVATVAGFKLTDVLSV